MKNIKKFEFNYDLSGLQTWSNENATDMLLKSVLGMTLPRYSSIRPGLRGTTEKVAFMTNDVILQSDSCGFSATGDTSIDQVTVDMCNKKINSQLCPYDLYDYFLSQRLSATSNFQESVPFEELLITDVSNRTAEKLEIEWFQNTISGGDCFDGVDALITSGNGATQIVYTASTSSTGLDVFTAVYEAIPQNVLHRNDLVIYCSYADYRGLVASMRNSSYINLFNFDDASAAQGSEWSLMLPGTNVMVVPSVGVPSGRYYGGPSQYVMIGLNATDNNGIELRSLYDPYQDVVKVMGRLSYGIGVFDPASWVVAK